MVVVTADGRTGILRGIELAEGERRGDIEIELFRGARVRVSYVGSIERVTCGVWMERMLVAVPRLKAGSTATVTVPPGSLTVVLGDANGILASREVVAVEAEEVEVDFRLP